MTPAGRGGIKVPAFALRLLVDMMRHHRRGSSLAHDVREVRVHPAGTLLRIDGDALGEQHYPATVKRIFPTIDPQTRKGMMEVQFATIPEGARPGQLCRVTVNTQTTPRQNVPFAAIRHDSQGEFVYRLKPDDTVELVRVETGILLGNQMEILEGIKVNDRVVIKGFIGLREGKKIIPVNTKSTAVNPTE